MSRGHWQRASAPRAHRSDSLTREGTLSSYMLETSVESVGSPTPPTTLRIALLGPVEVSCEGADVTLTPLELNLLVSWRSRLASRCRPSA